MFRDNIDFLLNNETHPHHVMCEAFGVRYEDTQVERMALSAQAYVDHMMRPAQNSLGVLTAALLPCLWTYTWAARWQMDEQPVAEDNPFREWWEFYADAQTAGIVDDYLARFDALAEQAGPAERARMARAFEDSCQHEIRFWKMAWTQQTWESQVADVQLVQYGLHPCIRRQGRRPDKTGRLLSLVAADAVGHLLVPSVCCEQRR